MRDTQADKKVFDDFVSGAQRAWAEETVRRAIEKTVRDTIALRNSMEGCYTERKQ